MRVIVLPSYSCFINLNELLFMKKLYFYLLAVVFLTTSITSTVQAQVTVVATAGVMGPTNYPTLNAAFTAINAGTHQGTIGVGIAVSTIEAGPCVLNSSGSSGGASYTAITIGPISDGVSISGPTTTGRGLIELKGADNVTIDGDNPNTGGTNRNLSIINTAVNTTTFTSCIRIANAATVVTSSDNIIIRNVILTGSATGRNLAGVTSTTGSENTTFGIYAGGNGGATDTDAPTAIANVTTNTAPAGTTINNLLINNCAITSCARGIGFLGANTTVSTGVTITNNLIGEQATTLAGSPPFTTPTSTVYTKGIFIAGTNSITVTGNTLKNILSYVATPMSAIELNANIGTGTINISNNIITGLCQNSTAAQNVKAILLANSAGAYTVSGNTISNIQAIQSGFASGTTTVAIELNTAATSGLIELNKISQIYSHNPGTTGAFGINVLGSSVNLTIQNNFISDLKNDMTGGFSFDPLYAPIGIRLAAGNNHKVYNNSVQLFGTFFGTTNTDLLSACFTITGTGQTGIDVRNNIFSNVMSGGGANTMHTCIFLPSGGSSAMNLTWNNNVYYSGSTVGSQEIGQVGTTYAAGNYYASNFNPGSTAPATNLRSYTSTLSVAGTNDNASSASTVAAPFVSTTDLHINNLAPNAIDIDAKGTPIAGLTLDIDANVRNVTTPDVGADEFSLPGCVSASGGTISPASYNVCNGQTLALSSTGATSGLGITYQWKVSTTSGGPYSNVVGGTGATTTSYTTGALTVGTYYYVLETTCSTGPVVGLSNQATVTVNPVPTASASSNTPLCEGNTLSLTGTTDIGTSFSWSGPAGYSSTSQSPSTGPVTVAASGTYSFVSIAAGCSSSVATTVVTVSQTPTGVMATATDTIICAGDTIDLNAMVNPYTTTLLTENFNAGAPTWTRVNNSTGGTPANAAWTDRPDGFVYAAGTPYHSNDNSQFVQSNSDAQGSGSTTSASIQSPGFATTGLSNVTVDFYHYYRDIADNGDSAAVEASLDGISWTTATAFNASTGSENNFTHSTVVLPAMFNNQPTVMVRFRFNGTWDWYWSIDNVSVTASSNNYTFAWTSTPIGFTSAIQNPVDVVPPSNISYDVTVTNPFGCSATATRSIVVNTLPTVGSTATPNDSICTGDAVTLSGTGATSYLWDNSVTDGVAFNPASTNTYTVTGTDALGCSNTSSVTITISQPTVGYTISANDTVCTGDLVTFNGTGAVSYVWTGGVTNGVAAATAQGTYTVTGTDGLGCTNTSVATLTVNPLPTVSYTVVANDTVCAGGNVTLSGTGASSYLWTGGISNAVAFTPGGSLTYTVTGTDVNGCTNTASAPIVVNPLPTVSYTVVANDTVCPGTSVTLSGTGASSYLWTGGISNGVSFTPVSSLTYTVTGTDANGCTNTASAPIVVGTVPTVNLGPDVVQPSPPALLDAGAGFSSYLWSTTAITQTISVTTNGQYIVTVTNSFGCTDSDTINVNFTSGVVNVNGTPTLFSLYPNPTSNGVFNVSIENIETTNLVMEVLDMTGRVVNNRYIGSANGNVLEPFSLTELRTGTYVMRITANGKSTHLRFIINK